MRRFALPSISHWTALRLRCAYSSGSQGTSVAPSGRWLALAWYDFTESGMISVHDRSGRLADSMRSTPRIRCVGYRMGRLCLSPDARVGR